METEPKAFSKKDQCNRYFDRHEDIHKVHELSQEVGSRKESHAG